MTQEEQAVHALAGRDLDRAVAVEVMQQVYACPCVLDADCPGHYDPQVGRWGCLPPYSGDMNAAWAVVEKLAEAGWWLELVTSWGGLPLPGCLVRFCRPDGREVAVAAPRGQEAVAVCQAALRAVRSE